MTSHAPGGARLPASLPSTIEWPEQYAPERTGPGFPRRKKAALIQHLRPGDRPVHVATVTFHPDETGENQRATAEYKTVVLNLDNVRDAPYITFLEDRFVALIRLDVDTQSAYNDLRDFACPPNLAGFNITTDPFHRGRYQLFWLLQIPVSMNNDAAVSYLKALQKTLVRALTGDKSASGDVVRNPWYGGPAPEYFWHWLHDRTWELKDLQKACAEYGVELPKRGWFIQDTLPIEVDHDALIRRDDTSSVAGEYYGPRVLSCEQRRRLEQSEPVKEMPHYRPWRVGIGTRRLLRNCSAFLMVSERAAARRRAGHMLDEDWTMRVLDEINELIEDDWGSHGYSGLPESELRTIARSVTTYWNEHFDPNYAGGSWFTDEARRKGGQNNAKRADFEDRQKRGTEAMKLQGKTTREKVRLLSLEGLTAKEIAQRINKSDRCVQGHLKALREAPAGSAEVSEADRTQSGVSRAGARPLNT